jgi:bacillithiol system protein YtxJ
MGFLENLGLAKAAPSNAEWKILDNAAQLEQITADSFHKPVVLFKDSTSCGISARAKYELEKNWDFNVDELDFYYLDLLTYRPISNQIAADFGVTHQSPQIILLKNGQAVYNTSHHRISVAALREALPQSQDAQ